MALEAGSLFASLSLRTAEFSSGMKEAVTAAKAAGEEMEKSFGKRPQRALEDTEKKAARTTWTVRGYIKDTSRVITGILISQAFYTLLRTIRENISAVWELAASMEQAAIQFKYLISGNERASRAMVRELKIFAAETPFTLMEATKASRTLLAAGFDVGKILPTMQGLVDVAAATGAEYTTIADIFGQIKSEGRLTAMTMRRLQRMAIPVTHILQRELGLTADQIVRIGQAAIPADVAIEALLRGWDKEFKGAALEIERTLKGMMNTIADYSSLIFAGVLDPLFSAWKNTMGRLLEVLQDLYEGIERIGIAYLLERLVPEELHTTVRVVIGALNSLWESLKRLWEAIKPVVAALGEWLVRALAAVLPVISGVVRALTELFRWATANSRIVRILVGVIVGLLISSIVASAVSLLANAIKLLGIAQAVGVAVGFLAKAIRVLYIAMTEHPIIAVITLLAAVLIGLAMSIKSVSDWLDRVMKQFASFFGIDVDEILQPASPEDLAGVLDEIGAGFEDLVDDIDDVGRAMKDTFLASFDEVYPIPDKIADISKGLKGITFPSLPGLPEGDKGGPGGGGGGGARGDDEGVLDKIRKKWSDFFIPLPAWEDWIPPLGVTSALFALALLYDRLKQSVRNYIDEVQRVVKEGVTTTIPQALANAWSWACDMVSKALDSVALGLSPALVAIFGFVTRSAESFSRWRVEASEKIREFTERSVESFSRWRVEASEKIREFTERSVESFSRWRVEASEKAREFGTRFAAFMEDNKVLILGIVAAIILAIILAFVGLPAGVVAAVIALVPLLGGVFGSAKKAVAAETDATEFHTTEAWRNIRRDVSKEGSTLEGSISRSWTNIKNTIRSNVNLAIDFINVLIRAWNRLKFDVPQIKLGNWSIGGGTIGVPQIGEIRKMQHGGIIPRDMLVRAGEHGKEAIVPLTAEDALPFARAIAGEVAAVMPSGGASALQPLYVGTLIADERGLKELERRMRVIRVREDRRVGDM